MRNPSHVSDNGIICVPGIYRLVYRPVYSGNAMKEIGSYEAKTNLPALLREVADGVRIVITRSGKPVADLVPHSGQAIEPETVIEQLREMRQGVTLGNNDLKELIREGRR